MKLPLGKGIWPAFWMLGANNDEVRWPACGEIDMMENIGEPGRIYSTLHGPGYSGAKGISEPYNLPAGEGVNTDFMCTPLSGSRSASASIWMTG